MEKKITLTQAWEKINQIDIKQQTHEQIMDRFAIALIELQVDRDYFKESMMTKAEFRDLLARFDKDAVLYQKIDQEQTMHSHRLREHTDQIEKNTKEIKALQLAAV